MLHVLIWDGYVDRGFIDAHTAGFEAARDAVRELTPEAAARVCGVNVQKTSSPPPAGSASPGPRCRYGARDSTSPSTAPTTARR